MTNQTRSTDFRELSQAVAGLTEALTRRERRYHHLARISGDGYTDGSDEQEGILYYIQHGLDDGPHG